MGENELHLAVQCFCRVILQAARAADLRGLRVELLDEECMIVCVEAGDGLATRAQRFKGFAGAVFIDGEQVILESDRERCQALEACDELKRRFSENIARILSTISTRSDAPRP